MTSQGYGQHLVNIHSKMRFRNLEYRKQLFHRWRPMSQNLAATRELNYRCMIRHASWWDHEVIHHPHGRNIAHSWGRCYFLFHRLPMEVFFRRLPSRISGGTRMLRRRVRWVLQDLREALEERGVRLPTPSTG